jgi:hypothetical protein
MAEASASYQRPAGMRNQMIVMTGIITVASGIDIIAGKE